MKLSGKPKRTVVVWRWFVWEKLWKTYGKTMEIWKTTQNNGTLWEKPKEHFGKTYGTLWENCGNTYGKLWDNLWKTMGKLWRYEELLKTDGNTMGKRGNHMQTYGKQWDNYMETYGNLWTKLWGKTLRSYGKKRPFMILLTWHVFMECWYPPEPRCHPTHGWLSHQKWHVCRRLRIFLRLFPWTLRSENMVEHQKDSWLQLNIYIYIYIHTYVWTRERNLNTTSGPMVEIQVYICIYR